MKAELGFKIPRGARLVFGNTQTGFGKETGAATVLPYLGDIPILHPSDGSTLTRRIWQKGHDDWVRNGGSDADPNYHELRAQGTPEWKLLLANAELRWRLRNGPHLFSMHGAFGYGTERTVAEIDVKVAPEMSAPRTRVLVPLQETADELMAINEAKGRKGQQIEVVGFLTPERLKKEALRQQRIETMSQAEPTPENPLRLAFMTTGQYAHWDMLEKQFLGDERIRQAIYGRRITMDIFAGTDARQAQKVLSMAQKFGFYTTLNEEYDHASLFEVQVFSNPDIRTAVEGSMAMAEHATVVASPIAERVGWTPFGQFIALPAVGETDKRIGNRKMAANKAWAVSHGFATPLRRGEDGGDVVFGLFGSDGAKINTHFENADTLQDQIGDYTSGAPRAAEFVSAYL